MTFIIYKKSRDGNDFNTFHNLCDNIRRSDLIKNLLKLKK